MFKKEKENFCEISILGVITKDYKLKMEEIFENTHQVYHYDITTFILETIEKRVVNTIELHQNKNDTYENNPGEFLLDNKEFYKNVTFIDKIDEYILLSRYFLKYYANTIISIDTDITAKNIEVARCEDNIDIILQSIGFVESLKIKKKGDCWRYKNSPLVAYIYKLDKLEKTPSTDHSTTQSTHG